MTANSTLLVECRDICLNKNSDISLYQQLYNELRNRILNRRLMTGMRLPASRELAKELKVSRNTVQQAIYQLQAEGYLEAKVGSGVYVAALIPDDYHQVNPTSIDINPSNKISSINKTMFSHFAENTSKFTEPELLSNKHFTPGMPDIDMISNGYLKIWLQYSKISSSLLDMQSTLSSLQQALCDYLRYSRAVYCEPQQILITHGAQQALDLICRVFINPGDMAVIEEPGYTGMRTLLQASGANLLSCEVDHSGLIVDKLPHKTKQQIKLIYTTPTHQYPLGSIMPVSRRLKLLEKAAQLNTYLIEDDYDSEFHYTSKPLPSLHSLDTQQRVLYVGSFSKVLNPFLRLGYLVIPKSLINIFTKINCITVGYLDPIKQLALAEFIQTGSFGRHLKRMRLLYANKMQCLLEQITMQLSEWVEIGFSGAGMHLVIFFKKNINDQALVEELKQKSIACKALSNYYLTEHKKFGLILGFAHMQEKDIVKGISVIRDALISN